jgi:hypothetical protein
VDKEGKLNIKNQNAKIFLPQSQQYTEGISNSSPLGVHRTATGIEQGILN